MRIIAIEEHIVSKEISKATAAAAAKAYPFHKSFLHPAKADMPDLSQLFSLGEERIAIMDKAGVSMEVVSYTNLTQWLQGAEAIPLAQAANNALAQAVNAFPSRFRAFAALPWGAGMEAASSELKRCVQELGFVGCLISGRPSPEAIFLDDKRHEPIWQVFTSLDLPLYIHPNFPCAPVCEAYYSGLGAQVGTVLSAYGWGWHVEAGLQVLRMILAGVFERHPGLKIISGHWGETLPYWLCRLDQMLPPAATGLPRAISSYYKSNVWITPSGLWDYDCLDFCVRKAGIDHILFSTDFPYLPENGAAEFIDGAPLSEAGKQAIASGNAERLLKIKLD